MDKTKQNIADYLELARRALNNEPTDYVKVLMWINSARNQAAAEAGIELTVTGLLVSREEDEAQ